MTQGCIFATIADMKQLFEKLMKREETNEVCWEKELKIYPYTISVSRTHKSDRKEDFLFIRKHGSLENSFGLLASKEDLKKLAHALLEIVYSE